MVAGAWEQAASCDAFVLSRRLPAPDAPPIRTSPSCLIAKTSTRLPCMCCRRLPVRGTFADAWSIAVRTRGFFTHRDDFQKPACVERGLVRTGSHHTWAAGPAAANSVRLGQGHPFRTAFWAWSARPTGSGREGRSRAPCSEGPAGPPAMTEADGKLRATRPRPQVSPPRHRRNPQPLGRRNLKQESTEPPASGPVQVRTPGWQLLSRTGRNPE